MPVKFHPIETVGLLLESAYEVESRALANHWYAR